MRFERELSERIANIYDAAYLESRWSCALDAITSLTASSGALLYAASEADAVSFVADAGSTSMHRHKESLAEYARLFRVPENSGYDDVGIDFLSSATPGAPVLDTDIFDLEFLHSRAEVEFGKKRLGVFRRFYFNTSVDPALKSGCIIYYANDYESIPNRDIDLVETLSPHFLKALDITRWAQGLRQRFNAVLSALDRLDLGMLVFDTKGRLVLRNQCADELLSARDAVWLDAGQRLVFRDENVGRAVGQAVRDVSETANGRNRVANVEIAVPRVIATTPLLVIASPLRDAGEELEAQLSGCLLTLIDTERLSGLRVDAFGRAYGLTPSEMKVAALLMTGLTTPEIAEEIGVAPSTAKTHLKSLFSKTNSSNRVNFVWRAIQFAPPIL